jgi:hypothetical protein
MNKPFDPPILFSKQHRRESVFEIPVFLWFSCTSFSAVVTSLTEGFSFRHHLRAHDKPQYFMGPIAISCSSGSFLSPGNKKGARDEPLDFKPLAGRSINTL